MNISIRKFTKDDIPNKVRWINNPENNQFLHYDLPLCIDKTEKWFASVKERRDRYDCVICVDNVPVGLIGLLNIDIKNKKAEFYISMGEVSYKKCGIGFAATRLILDYAFYELSLHKVYLNVDSDNIAACKLYEKAGFSLEGEFIDDLFTCKGFVNRKRYAILAL